MQNAAFYVDLRRSVTLRFQTRHILLDVPLFHIPHLVLQTSQLHLLGPDLCLDLVLGFPLGDLIGLEVGQFLFVLLNGWEVGRPKCALRCHGK
jgi:hypothetical protein